MPRVLLFGAAWTAVLAVLAFAFWPDARPEIARPAAFESDAEAARPKPPPSPPPPRPRAGDRYPGWTVTSAYSAHYAMVIEVETERPDTALAIAAQVVEPVKDRYEEILLYVHTPGALPDELPARRVRWTKRGGYEETIYDKR
jgi:hypothetical protein